MDRPATFYLTLACVPECFVVPQLWEGKIARGLPHYRGGKFRWLTMKYRIGQLEPEMEVSGYREMPYGVCPEQWDLREANEAVFVIDMFGYSATSS